MNTTKFRVELESNDDNEKEEYGELNKSDEEEHLENDLFPLGQVEEDFNSNDQEEEII